MTDLFLLAGHSDSRDLTLCRTWFYCGPKTTTAKVSLVVVLGGWVWRCRWRIEVLL
jgi:hypothetical protein